MNKEIVSIKSKLLQLGSDIANYRSLVALLERQEASQIAKLQNICKHDGNRDTKHKYQEGGYDYRSESTAYEYCSVCGKMMNKKTFYGGYA